VIIVPHQFIGKEIIRNYSQPERIYNQRLNIGFSYDTPPNLVKQVLTSTALATQGIGEMALFTGEPSPVSIAAVDDLQVLVVYSDAVNTMIERQPSLGREIGQIIEARSKAVSMAIQADV